MKRLFVCTSLVTIIFITATTSYGAQYWAKTYGGIDGDWADSVQQTTDGGYIVGGSTYSFGAGSSDMWILKLNQDGAVTWQKTYSSYNDWGVNRDSVEAIQQTADGGYIVAGSSQYYDELFEGEAYDFLILKLDANGNITWQKIYHWLEWIFAHSIQQTLDGGYIVTGKLWNFRSDSDIFVLKLNNSGEIIWNKFYDNSSSWESASSIQQTSDGGFIVAGRTYDDYVSTIWIFKLANNGDITWQKNYAGSGFYYTQSIHQTDDDGDNVRDDGYIVVSSTGTDYLDDDHDILILKLNSSGNIMWQKTYGFGGSNNEIAESIIQTSDGGYVIGGSTDSFGTANAGMLVLNISSNGNIPDCDIIGTSNAIASDILVEEQDGGPSIQSPLVTVAETTVVPQDSSAKTSFACCYDTDDSDEDGTGNICDNCPETPNPLQEDTHPPQGNGIGDACDCECDFDCSGGVDATDVTAFLSDFGRSTFNNPCTNAEPCNGDVDCNGSCDANDVTNFLTDFGRSQFNNPCPACEVGDWCVYP